jgi:hypothetical protein
VTEQQSEISAATGGDLIFQVANNAQEVEWKEVEDDKLNRINSKTQLSHFEVRKSSHVDEGSMQIIN